MVAQVVTELGRWLGGSEISGCPWLHRVLGSVGCTKCHFKTQTEAVGMGQLVKVPALKLDDLNLIPGTHMGGLRELTPASCHLITTCTSHYAPQINKINN